MKKVPEIGGAYKGNTSRWFSRGGKRFRRLLSPLKGTPLVYLEIGVFEGASAGWVCQTLLTHPDSRGYGVDPHLPWGRFDKEYMEEIRRRAIDAIEPWKDKFTIIRDTSASFLKSGFLEDDSVDIIYVDGSHIARDVLRDAVLSWDILKPGGIMLFDDCRRKHSGRNPDAVVNGVDSFRKCYSQEFDILLDGIHTAFKKR